MAMLPERSRSLHNFTLPRLRWGNQRFLRCVKAARKSSGDWSVTDRRSSASEAESIDFGRSRAAATKMVNCESSNAAESFKKSSPLKPMGGGGGARTVKKDLNSNGIDEVREKLMFDLRIAADKMKITMLKEKEFKESNSEARPWNLRTRRAACTAPLPEGSSVGGSEANAENPTVTAKSARLRGLAAAAAMTKQQGLEKKEKEPRVELSISLSREEIKSDFLAMTGNRPARRPKKRPRIVQRQLNAIFPGSWLTEITADTYKVPDNPESGKG